jgi:hypothetical protein
VSKAVRLVDSFEWARRHGYVPPGALLLLLILNIQGTGEAFVMSQYRIVLGIIMGAYALKAFPQSSKTPTPEQVVAHMPTRPFLQKALRSATVPSCPSTFQGKGLLVLAIETSPNGSVASADLDDSSTPALVNSPAAQLIVASVKKWKFISLLEDGKAVAGASRVIFYVDCTAAVRKITVPDLPEEFR